MEDVGGIFAGIGMSAVFITVTVGVKHLCRKYIKGQGKHDDK